MRGRHFIRGVISIEDPVRFEVGGTTLARTTHCLEVVEADEPVSFYVPTTDVDRRHLVPSGAVLVCEERGAAEMFDIVVDNLRLKRAAWIYPMPRQAYADLHDHIGFDGRHVSMINEAPTRRVPFPTKRRRGA